MNELFNTRGFDLKKIMDEARENGREDVAELIDTQITNLQIIYDVIAQKHTSTNGENVYAIDVDYVKGLLK